MKRNKRRRNAQNQGKPVVARSVGLEADARRLRKPHTVFGHKNDHKRK